MLRYTEGTCRNLGSIQPASERSFFRTQLSPELICLQDSEKCTCIPGHRQLLHQFRDYLDSFPLLGLDSPVSPPDDGGVPDAGREALPGGNGKETSASEWNVSQAPPHC